MPKLQKEESFLTYQWYEVELTEEQAELYKEDEDAFWEKWGDEIEEKMDWIDDKIGPDEVSYELIEDEE